MEPGKCYYVRTLTDHWVGRCVKVGPFCVTMEEAAWIADSGRLADFMTNGKAANMEIEPVGEITCRWIAFLPWPHPLFTKQV